MMIFVVFIIGLCNSGSVVAAGSLYSEMLPNDKTWTLVLLSMCMVIGGMVTYTSAIFIILIGMNGISL